MRNPVILDYDDISPELADFPVCGSNVALIGRLRLGPGAVLGPRAVIRADGHEVTIGAGFVLGAGGTVHIAHGLLPTHVGDRVAAGEGAVIHACEVADDCVIGAQTVILDGSVIGSGAVLEPESIVFPGTRLEGGFHYGGRPVVQLGPVTPEDLAAAREELAQTVRMSVRNEGLPARAPLTTLPNFVASTARVVGRLEMDPEASVFFSCELEAGAHRIRIGAGSNVQDNSVLMAGEGDLLIGARTTIGHNVTLEACRIGDDCLIGMGAHLAPGTVVEDDTMVAAGARSAPGQHLAGGQLWAGSPAKSLGPLKDRHRQMIHGTIPHYIAYAQAFHRSEGGDLGK